MGADVDTLCRVLHAIYGLPAPSQDRLAAWRLTMRDVPPAALVKTIDDAPRLWPDRPPSFPMVRTEARRRVAPKTEAAETRGETPLPPDAPDPWGPLDPRPWQRWGQLMYRVAEARERGKAPDQRDLDALAEVRAELGLVSDDAAGVVGALTGGRS